MLRRIGLLLMVAALMLVAACGSAEQAVLEVSASSAEITKTRLNEDHADASTIQAQLAVGTLQLEEGELAIDEDLANELLPLWQALQALAQSETTASAEITAVLNQIQDSMQPEQIAFIAEQNITNEAITTMAQEGLIRLGGGGRGGAGGGPPAGGGDGGGGRGGAGGLGGAGGGAGGGGAAGGDVDPDALATRRAERFGTEGGDGDFLATAVTGSVVQLLSVKTGAAVERGNNPRGGNNEAQQIVNGVIASALGISEEALQTQVADGAVIADLIAASDIDIETLRSELTTALADTPPAQNGNLDGFINRVLGAGQ